MLDANDITRIFEYRAFQLSSLPGGDGIYDSGDVLDLLQTQIEVINSEDQMRGLTIGDRIKANLDRLDQLDQSRFGGAGQAGVKILGIGSGIEYFPRGAVQGFKDEFTFVRHRIARMLSLTYGTTAGNGLSSVYRG